MKDHRGVQIAMPQCISVGLIGGTALVQSAQIVEDDEGLPYDQSNNAIGIAILFLKKNLWQQNFVR